MHVCVCARVWVGVFVCTACLYQGPLKVHDLFG